MSTISGYDLILNSADRGPSQYADHSITLVKYLPKILNFSKLEYHQFTAAITGFHHIDVTRNLQGEFKVYFDSSLIIQYTDNTTTTSEKFMITSWIGDLAFDNITASDSIDVPPPTTTPTPLSIAPVVLSFVLMAIFVIQRRKKISE